MTRQETQDLIESVFMYRPYYKTTFKDKEEVTRLIDEWLYRFKDYDFKDVKENLDEFFRENESKIPTPFDLVKGLRTTTQKNQKGRTYIFCDVCNKPLEVFIDKERQKIDRYEADKHIARCHSVRYLQQLYRKWWKREIPIDEIQSLKEMNQSRFDEVYYSILKKAYDLMEDGTDEKFLAGKVLEVRNQNEES